MDLTVNEFEHQEQLTIRDQFVATISREAFGKRSYQAGLGIHNDMFAISIMFLHNRIRGYKGFTKPPDTPDSKNLTNDDEELKPKVATNHSLYKATRLAETGGINKSL